tara:strand:- start:714 stop:2822 length:2109 start_codon:yes stop_codon:yes gene_type:complete
MDGGSTSADFSFGDDDKALFGAGNDLQIYHDGSNSYILENGTGNLIVKGNAGIYLRGTNDENMATLLQDGAVTLYHDNTARIATTSAGVDVTGTVTMDGGSTSADFGFADDISANFGTGNDLKIYHSSGHSYISDAGDGYLVLMSNGPGIRLNSSSAEVMIDAVPDGAVTLYHDNSSKLATSASGVTVTGAVNPSTGITLADNVNLTLGTGSDATIDFSGSNLEIRQANDAQDTYFYDASGNARLRLDTDQGDLYLYNYDTGTDGPNLILKHVSASPADGDSVGRLYFVGDNSAGEATYFVSVYGASPDVTDGTEDGAFQIYVLTDGTNEPYITANHGANQAVKLYHTGNERLATTSAGVTITGDAAIGDSTSASVDIGGDLSTGVAKLEIGTGRSGNGYSYIDLVGDTTYTDYGLRIIREDSGANAPTTINHRGTGLLTIKSAEAADIAFQTDNTTRMIIDSGGNIGIRTTSPNQALTIGKDSAQATLELRRTNAVSGAGQAYGSVTWAADDTNLVATLAAVSDAADGNGGDFVFLNTSAASSTTNYGSPLTEKMRISSEGVVTKANQPAFQVLPSSDQSNVPIDTWTTVVFDSERFDVAGNFASNTFTAPVTGKYILSVNVRFQSIDADASYYYLAIVTSNEWYMNLFSTPDDLSYLHKGFNVVADMDASDTAYIQVYQSGGSAQTDIDVESWFSGYLLG